MWEVGLTHQNWKFVPTQRLDASVLMWEDSELSFDAVFPTLVQLTGINGEGFVKNLTLFCGGCSTEHDITFLSAQNVVNSIDLMQYNVTIIYISPTKGWFRLCSPESWELLVSGASIDNPTHFEPVGVAFDNPKQPWVSLVDASKRYAADIVFPVLHGTQGEDGCIQGLLTMLGLPYVGADTLASAVLMSKIRTKQVLQSAGISCVPFKAWSESSDYKNEALNSFREFGSNVFVKAANLGSAVGVYHVQDESELEETFAKVFCFDEWAMMEPAIAGREIETAVLGNREQWTVAGPGEIVKNSDFYSFDAKYTDPDLAKPLAAASVTEQEREQILSIAEAVARAVDCEGMCRVDGFLTEQGFLINEVNTIPGFTDISLYPGMWLHAGKKTAQLITELLDLAEQRQDRLGGLERKFTNSQAAS